MSDFTGILGTVGGLFGNWYNNKQIEKQNEASRQWSMDMYDRQRLDNLEDWNRQNEYNTPEAQMERFKAAGLNPNLIYGRGSSGVAAAPNKTQAQGAQFQPKVWNKLNIASTLLDLEQKRANINLTNQQTLHKEEQVETEVIARKLTNAKYHTQEERRMIEVVNRKIAEATQAENTELAKAKLEQAQKMIIRIVRGNDLLQKQLDWFDFDKWTGATNAIIGTGLKVGTTLGKAYKGKLSTDAYKAHINDYR